MPDLASPPSTEIIEAIIDAAFWASLRREEGYTPKVSLAFLSPAQAKEPLRFESPLPLTREALTKLGPAVERPGIHLGVWPYDGDLRVWGTARTIPPLCFVLEVISPGLLVIKHRRSEDSGKFINVAVLEGDRIKLLNQQAANTPDCPALVTTLLGFDSPSLPAGSVNVLVELAVSMRAHGRGGSLLVVPSGSEEWHESVIRPIRYSVSPNFKELAELMKTAKAERQERRWQDALRRVVDMIAGFTAVDGATVISDSFELLAFGAKIGRRMRSPEVQEVLITEPVEGDVPRAVHPGQLGGTRHLSAAQFVHDQRDAMALVASQDGRFTIFAWSPCEQMVQTHRVESLLL